MGNPLSIITGLADTLVQYAIDYWFIAVFGVLVVCTYVIYKMLMGI